MRFPKTLDLKFDIGGTAEAQLKAHVLQEYQHNAHLAAQVFADNMSSSSESSSQDSGDEDMDNDVKLDQGELQHLKDIDKWQQEYA